MKGTANQKPLLLIIARHPRVGKVKTRLGREIGNAQAFIFYRNLLSRLMRQSAHDPRWETGVAFTEDFPQTSDFIPARLSFVMTQKRGGLGARLYDMMLRAPHRPCLIIGSDSPELSNRHVAQAFRALKSHDAVFGPALDGGFYLIGLRPCLRPRAMFDNVRWSSAHALKDTIRALQRAMPAKREKMKIARLEKLADIDTAADYKRWKSSAKLQGR